MPLRLLVPRPGMMAGGMIICTRKGRGGKKPPVCHQPGAKPGSYCGKLAAKLCDYVVDRWGRTCSAPLCRGHAIADPERWAKDYCPEHAEQLNHKEA